MEKVIKKYDIPENIIEFNIPIPIDDNELSTTLGQSYPPDSFEYKIVQHFCNGEKLPDFSPFLLTRQFFQENGYYTNLRYNGHPDSAYFKFWESEQRKCIDGIDCDIDRQIWKITGYYYWYLTFSPIHRVKEIGKNPITGKVMSERTYALPDIYDIDYFWFLYVDEARNRGQHASCLKKRGIGFSFKAMSMLTRNFYMIPKSKGYAVAESWDYLTKKDGLINKVSEHLAFIDEFTAFGKRRQVKDTDELRRTSYWETDPETGNKIQKGYMSEMIAITLEGKPDKMRGLRGQLILYEESGNNACIQQAWEISRSSVEAGDYVYGQLISFGTGGTIGSGFEGLERMTRDPNSFNIYGIPNIWERNRIRQRIGFFVPDYICREGNIDKHGNSDMCTALQSELKERETKKGNPLVLRQRMAEHPFTIDDAIMRTDGSPFDLQMIREQKAELMVNPIYKGSAYVGEMIIKTDGIVDFKVNPILKPIMEFDTKKGKRLEEQDGCIVIYEMPVPDSKGKIGFGWYVAGTDPINLDRDDVKDNFSLASTFILNRFTRRIVAEYTGRPRLAATFYEQLRRLLLFYNCQTLLEVNIVGVFEHFNKYNCTHLLAETPSLFRDMNIGARGMGNNIGVKSDPRGQVKALGRQYIIKWMEEVIENEVTENGEVKTRFMCNTIRSIPLLQEMEQWCKEGNYDRIDALSYALLHLEEKVKIVQDRTNTHKSVLNDPFWHKLSGNRTKQPAITIDRNGMIKVHN